MVNLGQTFTNEHEEEVTISVTHDVDGFTLIVTRPQGVAKIQLSPLELRALNEVTNPEWFVGKTTEIIPT